MLNAVIRAPLLTLSGYGVHSRQVYAWMERSNRFNICTQPVNWGNTTWLINPDYEKGMIGRIMSQTGYDPPSGFDISFQVQLPDEWDPDLARVNVGITAAVETDRCSPAWVECCNRMDAVIVPSFHTKKVIQDSGSLSTPIYVVPEWYFEEIDSDNLEKNHRLDLELDTSFNFLLVGTFTGGEPLTDRKNIYSTVKWFCEAFEDDPDVTLVLKTSHGRGTRIDRQITRNKIRALVSEVRSGPYPKIKFIHGNLFPDEMVQIYKDDRIHCLLSLTRGEGFGLPLLEASACELPVIVTNWSAHLDFLKIGKFIPIDYKLVEIPDSRVDNRIFIPGTRWAEPVESDFKRKVIKLRNKYDMPKKWASDLSAKVRDKFSSSSIRNQYDEVLEKILESK